MNGTRRKIPVVPCSGIGKSLGAAAREAAFILAEDLRPDTTKIVALSLLVMGDEQAKREVAGGEAVAIDGCKLECAAKGLACSGAARVHKVAVFDVIRRHRGLKPEGVCDLNEDGLKLARATADEAAKIVDDVNAEVGHA
ncbi:MAG: putative zinc-binding protein [Candidatus Aminicenantales bacterium]